MNFKKRINYTPRARGLLFIHYRQLLKLNIIIYFLTLESPHMLVVYNLFFFYFLYPGLSQYPEIESQKER